MADIGYYFERFGWGTPLNLSAPADDLSMVVVIPCRDEPDLVESLQALHNCDQINGGCEVIVIINEAEGGEASRVNSASATAAREWFASLRYPKFDLHVVEVELPRKKAGVGLARKIGMDEAVRRLALVGRLDSGIVVCFDADCHCDRNLLVEIEKFFDENPAAPGCSVRFEHPLEAENLEAIVRYELHLRFYIEACRYAGHPFAFHTVGSSMAVRSCAYIAQGGMNKRQAGEDFYFLQKIIPLGGFGEVNGTRVIPSPRVSDRVPFGTGKAVGDFLRKDDPRMDSYPIEAFEDLRVLFSSIHSQAGVGNCSDTVKRFIAEIGWDDALAGIRSQTTSDAAFIKRFFRWFDAFKVMKYVHYARDESYGTPEVRTVAHQLWMRLTDNGGATDAQELLERYRERQRTGWRSILE